MGLSRNPLIRELIDLSKLSWNQGYDFLIHREKKTVTMTLWDSIDPSSTSWYAMFRGTFDDMVGFEKGDMIAAWTDQFTATEEFDESSLHMRQLLMTRLTDLDLSVRALNCLKAAEIDTLGDLVSFDKNDLLKFRNFGKKSLSELEDLVSTKGLQFGMDISKYKIEK